VTLQKPIYTTLQPGEVWKIYNAPDLKGLFRGGGTASSPELLPDGPRKIDFDIELDPATGILTVYPNAKKGLSFADSLGRIRQLNKPGRVWMIPAKAPIPAGLVVNFKTLDHPLINVAHEMSLAELIALLGDLANLMKPTDVVL
jgi:hypothetical protein